MNMAVGWLVLKVLLGAILAGGVLIGLVLALELWKSLRLFKRLKLPGPDGFFAGLKPFSESKGEFHTALQALTDKFGSMFRLQMFFDPAVIVTDLDVIKQVWVAKNLPKSQSYPHMAYILGDNLLTENGEEWKMHRKLLQSGFQPQQLAGFVSIFQQYADELCDVLGKMCAPTGAPKRIRVDDLIQHATLDIIAASSMRFRLECLHGKNQDLVASFNQMLEVVANPLTHIPLGKYLVRFLHRGDIKRIDDVIYKAIAAGRKDLPGPGKPNRDLLDALLTASDDSTGLSAEAIRNQILIFFIAGHDTTAVTLSFALYEIARQPAVMHRLVDEVKRVCGNEMPTADQLPQLTYMTMALKETLRMHPPVATASRRVEGEPLQMGGITVPPGVMVQIPIAAVHNRTDVFPDPYHFDPERFSDEAARDRHPMAFIPFTQGPRICLGMNFFWLEGRLLFARLLQRFTFSAVDGFEVVQTTRTGTTKARDGVFVNVALRS